MPGFFGFFGSGFELPPLGLGAAGAGPRGVCGELLGEWHGDGAPKLVGTPDTEYGTSSRELEHYKTPSLGPSLGPAGEPWWCLGDEIK